MLDQIRIVLINTSHPGNIGGTARAMKNMGLTDLVLVDPVDFPSEIAEARASGATDVLEQAKVVSTLEEALADTHFVVGTSARSRHIPWPLMNPRELGGKARQAAEAGSKVAILFGREASGLTNEELARCDAHVHIPTNPDYSSLNLAMAVQVLGYEIRMHLLDYVKPEDDSWGVSWDQPMAERQELEGFFAHLEQTLVDIEFLDPNNPKQLMPRLRRVFQRTALDKVELNILRGILKHIQKKQS